MSGGASILYIRWRIMGTGPPAFTEVDNPASFADSLFVRVSYEVAFFWPAQNICLCHQIEFSFLCFKETVLSGQSLCFKMCDESPSLVLL